MKTLPRPNPIRHTLAVALIGSLAIGFGTITAAANDVGMPKADIRYGDLNLGTAQGATVLYKRIVSASYAVCQSFDRDRNDNADPWTAQSCRKRIIADAVAKIAEPKLYSLFNAKNALALPTPVVTVQNHEKYRNPESIL